MPSAEPDASIRPSGEMATDQTSPRCPRSRTNTFRVVPVPYDERAIATGRRHGPAIARVGDGRDPARVFVQSIHDSALGDVPDHQPANLVADQQLLAIGREDRGCELESDATKNLAGG